MPLGFYGCLLTSYTIAGDNPYTTKNPEQKLIMHPSFISFSSLLTVLYQYFSSQQNFSNQLPTDSISTSLPPSISSTLIILTPAPTTILKLLFSASVTLMMPSVIRLLLYHLPDTSATFNISDHIPVPNTFFFQLLRCLQVFLLLLWLFPFISFAGLFFHSFI